MRTATSTIMHFSMGDDGIVRAVSRPGVEPTAEFLKEAEAACRVVRREKRRPAIWDIRDLVKPNPTAWVSFVETAPKNLLAIAVVGETQQIEMLGAIPEIIDSLLLPLQLFTDEGKALEWAADFVE